MCGYASPSMSKAKMDEREKQYRAEDDHRTMTRMAEIEGDPERMKYVREHHRKMSAALGRVGKRINGRGKQRA